MKKDITRFGISSLITICLLVVVDLAVGFVGDRLAWNMPNFSGQIAKDNYRLHRMDAEVVIIGSSRGAHHYVTSQLNDSIDNLLGRHVTVYNAAIQGKFANSNCCAAEVILSRYRPKLVIFDMPENQMQIMDVASDIGFSSPYYWTDTIVRRYLDNVSLLNKITMKSSLCRYNSKVFRILSSYLQHIPKDDGYAPMYGCAIDTLNSPNVLPKEEAVSLNPYSVINLENVFNKCKEKGVPLIMVCSPKYKPNKENNLLAELCKKHDVIFIDYCDSELFNTHPLWFHDAGHLNDEGAHVYTDLFFTTIKPILSEIDF